MTSPLEQLGEPLAYPIEGAADLGLDAPETDHDRAVRTRLRKLEWMQKEALATDAGTGQTWRLPTDEGPYLDAPDVAPPPLGFTTAALLTSYASEIRAVADRRGIDREDLDVAIECFYTAEGSRLGGTRTAIALAPDLEVAIDADVDDAEARDLVETAVRSAPVHGALGTAHENRFALSVDGRELAPEGLTPLPDSPYPDPADRFEAIPRDAAPQDPPIIRHTGEETDPLPDAETVWAEKLDLDPGEEPGHVIHLRGTVSWLPDGRMHVRQETYSPLASVFEFVADDPHDHGGEGRAPDPLHYLSVAPAFCLTTHLAEFGEREGVDLDYRIVQDTHFSYGDDEEPATAEAIDTHVFFETPAEDAVVAEALRRSERSCFVHDLWRSVVEPEVTVRTSREP